MRLVTLSALGDDPSACPNGFSLDSSGAVCLPTGAVELGTPLPNYAAEWETANANQQPSATSLTTGLPLVTTPIMLPAGLTNYPAGSVMVGAGTACPAGYTSGGNGICVPVSTSWIPGVSNTMVVLGAVGALLVMMLGTSGGHR